MTPQAFQKKIRLTADLIRQSQKIILACHMNPDGDAIGSMLALGLGLRKLKKSVLMLCPDKIPERYKTLPGAQGIERDCHQTADLAISVDCGSLTQLAKLERAFERSKRIVEIDHHLYRTRFGDIQLVDQHVSSVGEIVLLVLDALNIKPDRPIAECLLISTLIETSSFSHPEINRATFEFCAKLMRTGLDFQTISRRYYWQKRLECLHLSGLALSRIKTRAKDQLAWAVVYRQDFEHFKGAPEDVDSVADDMMLLANVKVVLFFREIEDNMLRVSLRAREGIDVGYLAAVYGGGGHRDVAGCRIHNNPKTMERLINQASRLIHSYR